MKKTIIALSIILAAAVSCGKDNTGPDTGKNENRGSVPAVMETLWKTSAMDEDMTERLSVSYDGYYGLEQVSKKIDLMNAYEYAQLSKEAHDAAYLDLNPGGTAPNGSRPESFMNYNGDFAELLCWGWPGSALSRFSCATLPKAADFLR